MGLIVRTPNWLGDIIMSLPAVSKLAAKYPGMTIWSHPRVSGLIPIFFPHLKVFTAKRTGRNEFSRLLLMTDSFSSALQGYLSGIKERIGYRTDTRSILLTKALMPPSDRCHHHSVDYENLALELGASPEAVIPSPSVEPEGEPHVAVFSGARFGSAKIWPHFPEFARKLQENMDLPVVFYGSHEEKGVLDELSSTVSGSIVRTELTIAELASNLLSALLAVGNDSGGVHLSAVLGVPTVTIFGSTSPLWTAPLGELTATVYSERICSPCFKRKCPYGGVPECLNDISMEEVSAVCLRLTKNSGFQE